jgi:hypothetical protein
MLKQFGCLAAVEVVRDSGVYVRMTPGTREALIVLAATLPIIALVLFWVLVLRKPGRRHHRDHHEVPATLIRYRQEQQEDAGLLAVFRSSHRRRKRAYRRRNPTLADTGGLPPVRSGDPPSTPVTEPRDL